MKELTKAEEQVMQILWRKGECFVHDILQEFPEPKPAYNTISTFVRILQKKGFVNHISLGKSHKYYPIISKKEYTKAFFKGFMKNYFSNSYKSLASFFSEDKDLSLEEMEEIKNLLGEKIKNRKKDQ